MVLIGPPPSRAALGGGIDPDLHEGDGGSEDHFDGDETDDESGYLFSGPGNGGGSGICGRFRNGGWAAAWAAVDQDDDDDDDDEDVEHNNRDNEETMHAISNGSNDYTYGSVELTSVADGSGGGGSLEEGGTNTPDAESGLAHDDGEASSNGYQASTSVPQIRQRGIIPATTLFSDQAGGTTAGTGNSRSNNSANFNGGRGRGRGCLLRLQKQCRTAMRRGSKRVVLLAWLLSRPWVRASKWLRMVWGALRMSKNDMQHYPALCRTFQLDFLVDRLCISLSIFCGSISTLIFRILCDLDCAFSLLFFFTHRFPVTSTASSDNCWVLSYSS